MQTSIIRTLAASLTAAAAVGVAACGGGDAPAVSAASSSATSTSSSTTSSSATTQAPPPTTSSSTTSSSSSSFTPSEASGLTAGVPAGCTAKISPASASLKFGQPAVYLDDNKNTVCLTVKKLVAAPASAYGGTVSKANGTLYFMTVNYANVSGGSKPVESEDINQLELYPAFTASQKAKTLYSDVPGCSSDEDYGSISKGHSQDTCIPYQVTGAVVKSVVYDNYTLRYTWN